MWRGADAAAVLHAAEPPPGVSIGAIAEVGALVSDPARTNMLVALFAGQPLTARDLADRAGVTPQTASGHLSKLLAAGLITMKRSGRYHYHTLASSEVVLLMQAMHLAGAQMRQKGRCCQRAAEGGPAFVRACRGHFAGRLAVALADLLLEAAEGDGAPALSSGGLERLVRWGVDPAVLRLASEEPIVSCMDWSERRGHIGGALGSTILQHARQVGWVRQPCGGGDLLLTPTGAWGFAHRFGIADLPAEIV